MDYSFGPFALILGVLLIAYITDANKRKKQLDGLWKAYITALYSYDNTAIEKTAKSFCIVKFMGSGWETQVHYYIERADYMRFLYHSDGSLKKEK